MLCYVCVVVFFHFSFGLLSHPSLKSSSSEFFVCLSAFGVILQSICAACSAKACVFVLFLVFLANKIWLRMYFTIALHIFSRVKQFIQWHSNLLLYNFAIAFSFFYLFLSHIFNLFSSNFQESLLAFATSAHFSWFYKMCTRQPCIFLYFQFVILVSTQIVVVLFFGVDVVLTMFECHCSFLLARCVFVCFFVCVLFSHFHFGVMSRYFAEYQCFCCAI